MNVWERARTTLKRATLALDELQCQEGVSDEGREEAIAAMDDCDALLAEMERVECVEGAERSDGSTTYFYTNPDFGGNPALLLLLPEEER